MGKWTRPHRLKKEALQFFKEDLSTKTFSVEEWRRLYNIDENALEEIKEPVITYGRDEYGRDGSYKSGSLGGWSNPENEQSKKNDEIGGAHFCFTIHFPSVKYEEYDRFSKGRMLRGLMDRLQHEADYYFTQFVEGFTEEK